MDPWPVACATCLSILSLSSSANFDQAQSALKIFVKKLKLKALHGSYKLQTTAAKDNFLTPRNLPSRKIEGDSARRVHETKDITVPRPVGSCRQFLQDSFILSFFCLKNITRSTPPNCLLSNPAATLVFTEIQNTAYRSGLWTSSKYHFVPSKQEEHISSGYYRHFVPKDRNKLAVCAWQNRKYAEPRDLIFSWQDW